MGNILYHSAEKSHLFPPNTCMLLKSNGTHLYLKIIEQQYVLCMLIKALRKELALILLKIYRD